MSAEQPLEVSVAGDGALVITGEVDIATFDEVSQEVDRLLASADSTLVIDLSGVTFIDSSGLRLLLEANENSAARGVSLALRDPSAAVQRLLDITGLTKELRIT